MATRKPRNHAAEYARRKALAQQAGFKSERAYKSARRQAAEWSRTYSVRPVSQYRKTYTATELKSYFDSFLGNPEEEHYDAKQQHTIAWLHFHDPQTYPDADQVEWWDSYFG